ncbi:MAG: UDP-N-acetylglucosamine 2-epimerase (non-hydrolyzing) [Thermoprotei archaeon]|nr:MAG: UDP-N-acetylglucosamine 2-epimerase (non-hydrolyzing) [Thermoprotei archaeon]
MKLSSVIQGLSRRNFDFIFIWSGQHYDYEMSKIFFDELNLPEPDYDLDVRSGSHAEQTSRTMVKLERVLKDIGKSIVVAEGDTNTVLASALVCAKTDNLFAHVEAGLRSYDRSMPEEINRIVAGAIASVHFAPTTRAALNLLYEGVFPHRIFITGNTIVDVVLKCKDTALSKGGKLLKELGLKEREYALVTVHRAENVDIKSRLREILSALSLISKDTPLVFPIHPRTKKRVEEFGLKDYLKDLAIVKPLGYFEFLGLLTNSLFAITDSGGVQEECLTLCVPCITVRYNTERPETVEAGINFLTGPERDRIIRTVDHVIEKNHEIRNRVAGMLNPLGDGRAGKRIADILTKIAGEGWQDYIPDFRETGEPTYRLISGTNFEGSTISEFHERFKGIFIILIYDRGNPLIPYSDTIIRSRYSLRVFGPELLIRKYFRQYL